MNAKSNEVMIPLTNTGRKYGYISWRKKYDEEIKTMLGRREVVDLQIGHELQKKKRIDWEKRRISITYTLTRNLPKHVKNIILKRKQGGVLVNFE